MAKDPDRYIHENDDIPDIMRNGELCQSRVTLVAIEANLRPNDTHLSDDRPSSVQMMPTGGKFELF